jgi:outer membrane protein insertion porin family
MPLTLSFELEPRLKDPINDFDKRSWSTSASTRKRFGDKITTSLGIEYQFVKISGVPRDQVAQLKDLTDNNARRKIFAGFRRDSRDDLFIPSRGVVANIAGEYYGGFLGGDEDFFTLQADYSRYEVIWPGWISATRVKGSWSEAFGKSEEIPLDEAIYLGGANSVRGFAENSLGRFAVGDKPVAAKYTMVFNQEFRWKTLPIFTFIPFLNQFPLWQSVFFDVGNGYRGRRDIRWETLAYAYGTGFQIVSPAGPIRIDYARRITNETYDFDDRWHFTILYAF